MNRQRTTEREKEGERDTTAQHLLFISRQGANIGSQRDRRNIRGCPRASRHILHFRFEKCYNAAAGIPAPAIAISCLWSTASSPSRQITPRRFLSCIISAIYREPLHSPDNDSRSPSQFSRSWNELATWDINFSNSVNFCQANLTGRVVCRGRDYTLTYNVQLSEFLEVQDAPLTFFEQQTHICLIITL